MTEQTGDFWDRRTQLQGEHLTLEATDGLLPEPWLHDDLFLLLFELLSVDEVNFSVFTVSGGEGSAGYSGSVSTF